MKSNLLRIAFLVGNFPSLSETFILNQITGLIDAGHHVDIYALRRPEEDQVQADVDGYHLLERTTYFNIPENKLARLRKGMAVLFNEWTRHPLPVIRALNVFRFGRTALSMRLLLTLQPFLQREPYDIIHCHFGQMGLRGAQLKQMGLKGRLVVTFHGFDLSQAVITGGREVYQDVFDQADLILPVSHYWRDCLVNLGADPRRVKVHHMGIDPRSFTYIPRRLNGEIRLLTVSRLVEKKGVEYGLQAFAELVRRRPDLNVHYDIVGDGPLCADLQEQVRQLGLEGKAWLHGSETAEAVKQRIFDAHIFLLPSVTAANGDQEGIPVSLMEAMATGLPILSTRHTGIPELVQDGRSGYLVEERDIEGLTRRLEFLADRPELWPHLGHAGRDFVIEHHNIHRLNRQLEETFRDLYYSGRPTMRISPRESPARAGDV